MHETTLAKGPGRRPTEPARRPGGRADTWSRVRRALTPILWLGPALLLIFGIVLWPVFEMARASVQDISSTGLVRGFTGFDNYEMLFDDPDLVPVVIRTVIWVIGVVGVTVLISLGLSALINQRFPGRRLVRWALIVPWAASVVMSAIIWRWMLDNFYGVINRVLSDVGLIDQPIHWLADAKHSFPWLMWVAVFVSIPFTTYVLLAGLQTIPHEVYEAARIDGASAWRTYLSVTLPLLKPALLVATVINVINVFNSFPIIWAMTEGGPVHDTDTTTTFMYKIAFRDQHLGESAAMASVNFVLVVIMVLFYLRVVRWREE